MVHPPIISFESHVTIEPVFGERFQEFEAICKKYGFKPAELLLQKTRTETPLRSDKDSFCTGHSKTYDDLVSRTNSLVVSLMDAKFQIWRYKIEGIVLDVRKDRLYHVV